MNILSWCNEHTNYLTHHVFDNGFIMKHCHTIIWFSRACNSPVLSQTFSTSIWFAEDWQNWEIRSTMGLLPKPQKTIVHCLKLRWGLQNYPDIFQFLIKHIHSFSQNDGVREIYNSNTLYKFTKLNKSVTYKICVATGILGPKSVHV